MIPLTEQYAVLRLQIFERFDIYPLILHTAIHDVARHDNQSRNTPAQMICPRSLTPFGSTSRRNANNAKINGRHVN